MAKCPKEKETVELQRGNITTRMVKKTRILPVVIFHFFDIFQKFYSFILYTFLSMSVNLQGNMVFFLGNINKINSSYDLRITRF